MDSQIIDQDEYLDLWAEEPGSNVAAENCCGSSGSSASTLSSPFTTTSTVGSAGSTGC